MPVSPVFSESSAYNKSHILHSSINGCQLGEKKSWSIPELSSGHFQLNIKAYASREASVKALEMIDAVAEYGNCVNYSLHYSLIELDSVDISAIILKAGARGEEEKEER